MKPTNEQIFASVSFICKLFFHLGKTCKRMNSVFSIKELWNEEVGSQVFRSWEWTWGGTIVRSSCALCWGVTLVGPTQSMILCVPFMGLISLAKQLGVFGCNFVSFHVARLWNNVSYIVAMWVFESFVRFKVDESSMVVFFDLPTLPRIWNMRLEWANPNRGRGLFSQNFWSLNEYLIYSWSGEYHSY